MPSIGVKTFGRVQDAFLLSIYTSNQKRIVYPLFVLRFSRVVVTTGAIKKKFVAWLFASCSHGASCGFEVRRDAGTLCRGFVLPDSH